MHVRGLVLELVEGPTLAERLAGGALPLPDALAMARQIADALDAAHQRGIIHRDLKPANVKLTPAGVVKVLDFGLAKTMAADSLGDAANPTIQVEATREGMVVGTAAYMSPEQARGQALDKRTDIWAFGCVLYEMLTGRRAFPGATISDTNAAVLQREPDWTALPRQIPAGVTLLVQRCLEKDPQRRLRDLGDADLVLGLHTPEAASRGDRRWMPWAAATIASLAGGAVIGALAMWAMTRPVPQARILPSRFEIVPPPAQLLAIQSADRDIAISPDGQYIVYRADAGRAQLVVRALDRLDAHAVADIRNARNPFFSPDGQWIGFFDGAGLRKAPVAGGAAITIWKGSIVPRGASWGDDNSIVLATADTASGLLQV